MTAAELLKQVTALDIRLRTDGGKLLIDAPIGAVTPELKEMLSAKKPELIRLLSSKHNDEILPVFSKILDEVVYFVAHNDRERVKDLKGAVYFLGELETIVNANPKPDVLRLIHKAKREFEGTIAEGRQ